MTWHLSVIDEAARAILFHGSTRDQAELIEACAMAAAGWPRARVVVRGPCDGDSWVWDAGRLVPARPPRSRRRAR